MASSVAAGPKDVGSKREQNVWCGTVSSTWWFYFTGDSTDELWKAYVEHCTAMLTSGTPHPSLVCIAHRADTPTSEQRKMIADFIKSEAAPLSALVGFALVV